jgi:hypothetical protein
MYDNIGNFNAGAVAAALGIPENTAVKGADYAHRVDHGEWQSPLDLGDQWIRRGYQWYVTSYEAQPCH